MKVYTKPQMMTLSISANDALCVGCQIGTRNTTDQTLINLGNLYGNQDGFLTKEEASAEGLFGSASEACSLIVEGYCKFTATDENYAGIFTS